ncbi:MAG: class I SAM-dependent methyltransferase [Candidatus Omnitrophica bacterium]|nr:class I SAM-dependent methyltransferase [Candidatus Omnitrophota bacterium]MBU2221560.1 class I SAM-dependent methyltransferase [Candidatus Omnitrophota bacterium]MBU2257718.1 class I SAM-dependent methyltransferase [Candidatus Omnitrophota bacterium]
MVDFRIENGEQLNFDNGSFDAVFSINTIHHFSRPYLVVDELIRLLSSKGRLILSDFTEEGFKLMDKIHASEGQTHSAGCVSLEEIKAYLINKGFAIKDSATRFQRILIAQKGEAK